MDITLMEAQDTIVENGILNFLINEKIGNQIRFMLSSNWTVTREESGLSILVEGE